MPRPDRLTHIAEEQSTYIIKCIFEDENGDAAPLVTMNWDLTSVGGTVINGRLDVQVVTPVSPVYVVLSGDDLQILDGEESFGERIFTVRASYNSSLGGGLPLNKFVRFKVRNLRLIGYPLGVNVYDPVFAWDDREVAII